jgi:transposase-like protein/IS1 family transposase
MQAVTIAVGWGWVTSAPIDELFAVLRDLKGGQSSAANAIQRLEPARHWVWTAIDPISKLLVAIAVGPRTLEMAQCVVHHVVSVLAPDCVPVWCSDGFKGYLPAIVGHCGLWMHNEQIARELDVNLRDMHQMTTPRREGIKKKPTMTLSNEVECDEAYVIAGHKGQPEVVKLKGRKGRRCRRRGQGGRGTWEKARPPVFGMIQRGGQVVISLLANVKQKTIAPFIPETIAPSTRVYTDEYNIYTRLYMWGYDHKSVNHGRGEYARDEDGDGFCEVHVNTMEGFWSLLRSWLRPHWGISHEQLPLYLGFFAFVHNARKRGKALLHALIELLVS